MVGVAPGTPVYAVKTLDSDGEGFCREVICGIDWVTANARRSASGSPTSASAARGAAAACTETPCTWRSATRPPPASPTWRRPATTARTSATLPQDDPGGLSGGADGHGDVRRRRAAGRASRAPGCVDGIGERRRLRLVLQFRHPRRRRRARHRRAGVCISSPLPHGGVADRTGTSAAAPHVAGVVSLCAGEIGVPHRLRGHDPGRGDRADARRRGRACPRGRRLLRRSGASDRGPLLRLPGLGPRPRGAPPPGSRSRRPGRRRTRSVSLLRVHAVHRQRAGRLRVTVQLNEPGTAVASATVRPDESLAPRRSAPAVPPALGDPAGRARAARGPAPESPGPPASRGPACGPVGPADGRAHHRSPHDAAGNLLVKRRTVLLVR